MELEFFEQKEKDIELAVNWTELQEELNRLGTEYVVGSSTFLSKYKIGGISVKADVLEYLKSLKEHVTFDDDIKSILGCISLHGEIFDSSAEREKFISNVAISIFETFRDKITGEKDATRRAIIVSKILLFSSSTEILVSLMAEYSLSNKEFSKTICADLIKVSQNKFPVTFKTALDEKEMFQVSAPFIRAIIWAEQIQVSLVVANSFREYLNELDPQSWFEIAPLFKLCLDRQSKIMDMNVLTVEDSSKAIDSSIKDLLCDHQDIVMDTEIEISSMPNIIFRKYQDRTADRVSSEYLALIREVKAILPKISDVGILSNMIRYLQDYLITELVGINSNCFLYSEISGSEFLESLVVTLDKIREKVAEISGDRIELACFDSFIQYDLLPVVLKDGDLISAIDASAEAIAIRQIVLFRDILESSLIETTSENIFLSQLGCASPYRFISSLNWINWRDMDDDISFDRENSTLWSDPFFKPSLSLSWVIYKELSFNKLLVGVSS